MKMQKSSHLKLVEPSRSTASEKTPDKARPFDDLRFLSREARELCIALSATLSRTTQVDRETSDSFIKGELITLRNSWGIGFRDVSARVVWERLHHLVPIQEGLRFDLKPNGLPNIVWCNCAKRTVELALIEERRGEENGQYYLGRGGAIWGMCTTCIAREKNIARRKRKLGRNIRDPHFVSYARANKRRNRQFRREKSTRSRREKSGILSRAQKSFPLSLYIRQLTLVRT